MSRPLIAITQGDPAGIGPEVTLRAVARPSLRRRMAPLLVGDVDVFADAARRLRLPLRLVPSASGEAVPAGAIPVLRVTSLARRDRLPRRPTAAGGDSAYRAIIAAVGAVRGGRAAAMVTAPISKENLVAAGHHFPGHTELLAELGEARAVRMMMAAADLRVVLATTHVPLRAVPELLTRSLVLDTIVIADEALRRHFGIKRPRLAVCGLNPHAGEGGLFGNEDDRIIRPAIAAASERRIRAAGPLPADTVFARVHQGEFDAAIAMYHDQGLGPFKLLHFADGVNVTLGLPFVRTSPDHGTAFDIAGRNRADPASMIAAIEMAARLAG